MTQADVSACRVTNDDFDLAIQDMRTSSLELSELEVSADGEALET